MPSPFPQEITQAKVCPKEKYQKPVCFLTILLCCLYIKNDLHKFSSSTNDTRTPKPKRTVQKTIMRSRCCVFFWCAVLLLLLVPPPCGCAKRSDPPGLFLHSSKGLNQSRAEATASKMAAFSHRKVLPHGSSSSLCTNKDISISQSRDSSSTGIPQFIVQIVNTCTMPRCSPSGIHLHCGWFASARVVNPRSFKRLSYDDCLVNGGKALKPSQVVRFTYSNSFMYPLAFKYAKFC
ncbi:hypothetical protein BT93_L1129 [Corymbia citriodora subsp. variegata]|uniref:Uncharacterized protein n=1 Tax=Corymbia citriodora subsp. variegata TaxID=360336 RepID=A0A8T0CWQ7_CORYI|nr:hypothetical protein BT93_L1129 [Corymbia citriodora subsp. variegata]